MAYARTGGGKEWKGEGLWQDLEYLLINSKQSGNPKGNLYIKTS